MTSGLDDDQPWLLKPADVAGQLDVSVVQVMALLKSGDLVGIQLGGRNQWRISRESLLAFLHRKGDGPDPVGARV